MNTIDIPFEIVPADSGLEVTQKTTIETAFVGFFDQAAKWSESALTITEPKLARTARLELKNIRVAAEKKHKELKEDSLRTGRAIDGAKNILLAMIVPIEKSLEEIEKAAERAEAIRIESIRVDRADQLGDLEYSPIPAGLGAMPDDQWEALLQNARDLADLRHELERKSKEEAEAKAKAEAEEREAQRLENIRLKAEAEEREKAMAEERRVAAEKEAAAKAEAAAAEKARIAADEKARKEREAIEAKAKAEREAIEAAAAEERRKSLEAAAQAAKEKAAAESEAKRLRDAEAKRIADEKAAAEDKAKAAAAAAKKAASAPDKEKLQAFAHAVRAMECPAVKSADAEAIRAEIAAKVAGFANWIEKQIIDL